MMVAASPFLVFRARFLRRARRVASLGFRTFDERLDGVPTRHVIREGIGSVPATKVVVVDEELRRERINFHNHTL